MTLTPRLRAAFNDFVDHLVPGKSVVDQWAAYVEHLRDDSQWSPVELAAFGSHLRRSLQWQPRAEGLDFDQVDPFAGEGCRRITPKGI